jgi:hypothetical protein
LRTVELSAFLAAANNLMIARRIVTPVIPGLSHPADQSAWGKPKALGYGIAGAALLQAEAVELCLLLSFEPALDLVDFVIHEQSGVMAGPIPTPDQQQSSSSPGRSSHERLEL